MTIQNFIHNQLDRGFTLRRLSRLLDVTPTALSYHLKGKTKQVSLPLAESIYNKFDLILDGFHEYEFGNTDLHNTIKTMDTKILSLERDIQDLNQELINSRDTEDELYTKLQFAYAEIDELKGDN